MSDKHVVAALQRTVADLELRLREVVRERDEAYSDRTRARADRDEARAELVSTAQQLELEREHSARLSQECQERHDELRAEVERLRRDLLMLDEHRTFRDALRATAQRQREACALHLCPKVPHSACSDFHCEAGVVREAPLVTEGQP